MAGIKKGQRITLSYESREFEVIVIDPNGLGREQPSVGFGFNMMDKYAGVPQSTLSTWVIGNPGDHWLKLPSGKTFRVIEIVSITDNNSYSVIEASDWFELCFDLLEKPGKTTQSVKAKVLAFLKWFAIKGFYAEAYVALKGVYTERDSRATTQWLEARQLGKIARKLYTDLLQSEGCEGVDYALWTDYVYQGLFGMRAIEMKQVWERMEGDASIARNYIPKAEGLDAVRYCEDIVVRVFVDDLEEAHDIGIKLTRRKYLDRA